MSDKVDELGIELLQREYDRIEWRVPRLAAPPKGAQPRFVNSRAIGDSAGSTNNYYRQNR